MGFIFEEGLYNEEGGILSEGFSISRKYVKFLPKVNTETLTLLVFI